MAGQNGAFVAESGELPDDWAWKRVGDVAELVSGGTPPKANLHYWSGEVAWASPKDMKRHRLDRTEDRISAQAAARFSRIAPAGSTLVVIRGMILAKDVPVCFLPHAMAFNQDVKAVVPSGEVDGEFLSYAIASRKRVLSREISTAAHGTRRLSSSALDQLNIAIPGSLHEQQRIATALSILKSRTEVASQKLRTLRDLKTATMAKVFREGLRAEPGQDTLLGSIPAAWRLMPIVELAAFPRGLVDPRVEPYASMMHVGPENIESETSRLLTVRTAKEIGLISGKYLFEAGDVIYSKIRPYLKKVTQAMGPGLCSADMYPLRPNRGVPAAFLVAALLSDACTSQIVAHQDRTGIPKVNRDQLAGVLVPVPSDPLDRERIATIFDSMSCAYIRAAERIVRLRGLFDVTLQQLMTGALRLGPKSDA